MSGDEGFKLENELNALMGDGDEVTSTSSSRVDSLTAMVGMNMRDEIKEAREAVHHVRGQIVDLQSQLEDLEIRMSDLRTTLSQPAKALANFKAAITEDLKLQEARKL